MLLPGRKDVRDFICAEGIIVDADIVDQAVPEAPGLFHIRTDVDLIIVGFYGASDVYRNIQSAVDVQADPLAVVSARGVMPLPVVDADFAEDATPNRIVRYRQAHTAEFERVGAGVSLQPPGSVAFGDDRLVVSVEGLDLYPRRDRDPVPNVELRVVSEVNVRVVAVKLQGGADGSFLGPGWIAESRAVDVGGPRIGDCIA